MSTQNDEPSLPEPTTATTTATPLPDTKDAKASALKAQGNALFTAGRFRDAIRLYTHALTTLNTSNDSTSSSTTSTSASSDASSSSSADVLLPELWSNRAACFLKLGFPYLALCDAYDLLDKRPEWPKTYFRLGKACAAMGGMCHRL